MNKEKAKKLKKERRRKKIRAKIYGTSSVPRLSVFKSNQGMYLQLIDDAAGRTLASAHSREIKSKKIKKTEVSFELGKQIAKKAAAKKITKAVVDRGGNKYHGRIKAAADGAREAGMKI